MKFSFLGKKYKVVNEYRYKRFLRVLDIAILISFILLCYIIYKTTPISDMLFGEVRTVNDFKVVERTIKEGDTVWEIQKELAPNEDVREMVYLFRELNESSYIKAGDTKLFLEER